MKINLTQKEAQALLMASYGKFEDLADLKLKDNLSVEWKLMYNHLQTALSKSKSQYFKQLKKGK